MKSNTLNLTLKVTSLQTLITLVDKLPISKLKNIGYQNNSPLYVPYILAQGITDCIKAIMPELRERKACKFTTGLALSLGVITSALVSCQYNGINYILNFSFTLLKTSATTLIIDKLNKLGTIDGVSLAILISFIFSIPKIIIGLSVKPLIMSLLFIASIGSIAYGNFKFLQSTEDVNMHYNKKVDKFSICTRNTYTTSLIMSTFITGLVSVNPLIQDGLLLIINPLIQWFLSSSTINTEELNKHLQDTGIYLDGQKHGKDTEECLYNMIRKNSLKLGVIGAITYIISSLIIAIFAIEISPVILSVLVNCFINVSFSIKSIIKSKTLNNI